MTVKKEVILRNRVGAWGEGFVATCHMTSSYLEIQWGLELSCLKKDGKRAQGIESIRCLVPTPSEDTY